jgi:hypothetical protein
LYMSMIKSVKVQRNIIAVFLNRNLNESKKAIHLIKMELDR